MVADKRGLGRGIDTLFRNATAAQEKIRVENEITALPLSALTPCLTQPRKIFEDRPLEELAESIRKQGIIQPLLVRPIAGKQGKYEIVAGERRFRAAKIVGLAEVPVCVRDLSDTDAMAVALVENLQREDLNPIEEAEAMQALRDSLGISQDELATRLGKSRSAIANTLRLLQLSDNMRAALAGNIFTPGHARALLAIQDNEEIQRQLFDLILERQLTVRDAENAAQHYKRHGLLPTSLTEDARQHRQNTSRAPKPELLRDVQRLLRAVLHPKVTVSGSGDTGRVTIPYESADALAELLRKLGAEDLRNPETTHSTEHTASEADSEDTQTLACEEIQDGQWECGPESETEHASGEPLSDAAHEPASETASGSNDDASAATDNAANTEFVVSEIHETNVSSPDTPVDVALPLTDEDVFTDSPSR